MMLCEKENFVIRNVLRKKDIIAETLEEKIYIEGCGTIKGCVANSDKVCRRRVSLYPTAHHYEEIGEEP